MQLRVWALSRTLAPDQKAIAKRAIAVMREGGDGAEREALANAMQALIDLKRDLTERNRGTEPEKENMRDTKT